MGTSEQTVGSHQHWSEVKWSRSVVSDSATPWTVAHQAPSSMGFSRQEYWSGLPFPSPGDLPDPGINIRHTFLLNISSARLQGKICKIQTMPSKSFSPNRLGKSCHSKRIQTIRNGMELPICSQTFPQRESLIEEKRRNKQELLLCEEWPFLGLYLLLKKQQLYWDILYLSYISPI